MAEKLKPISVYIEPGLKNWLEQAAKLYERTLSGQIIFICKTFRKEMSKLAEAKKQKELKKQREEEERKKFDEIGCNFC